MLITAIILMFQILFVVSANLLVKVGAVKANETSNGWLDFFNNYLISGIIFFGLSFITMIFLLKRLPLNLAQAYLSLQYVAVTLAAYFILKESISKTAWLGILLIAGGVIIVGKTVA